MPFAYIVRCNFTDPAKEAAWNAWYSGPKIAQMLEKPQFRACQRFHRVAGYGRDYLALWIVESPQAFTTAQYTSDWGFFEWEAYVTDWSRDLFDANATSEDSFAVAARGALHVVSFDGMSADDAQVARAALTPQAAMMWLPIVGLDRHTPLIGLAPSTDAPVSDVATAHAPTGRSTPRVQQAIYRPISDFYRAA